MAMRFEQANGFLHDLLGDVAAGRAAPAAFQRPYAWGREDVEKLWTSILSGFPVGAFLLWSPSEGADRPVHGRSRIGPLPFEAGDRSILIVDGQNRLATFAWSGWVPGEELPDMSDASDVERETWLGGMSLVADPATRSVRFVPAGEADVGERMPAGLLLRESRLWPAIRRRDAERRPLSDQALDWLVDHGARRVQHARTTVTTLLDATVEEALDAFRLVCKTGVPISDEDLERALRWSPDAAPAP